MNKKYDYDISKIELQYNKTNSLRQTARDLGYGEETLLQWLKRNFRKVTKFERLK